MARSALDLRSAENQRAVGDNTAALAALRGGTSVFSGNAVLTAFNIPHGLGVVPAKGVSVVAGSAAARALFMVTVDATNITVTFAAAPANAANNLTLHWIARA